MPQTLEAVLKRDRVLVVAGLAGVAILAWLYLFHMGGEIAEIEMHTAMGMQEWGALEVPLLIMMWAVMMVAMMLPGRGAYDSNVRDDPPASFPPAAGCHADRHLPPRLRARVGGL